MGQQVKVASRDVMAAGQASSALEGKEVSTAMSVVKRDKPDAEVRMPPPRLKVRLMEHRMVNWRFPMYLALRLSLACKLRLN